GRSRVRFPPGARRHTTALHRWRWRHSSRFVTQAAYRVQPATSDADGKVAHRLLRLEGHVVTSRHLETQCQISAKLAFEARDRIQFGVGQIVGPVTGTGKVLTHRPTQVRRDAELEKFVIGGATDGVSDGM